MISKSDLADAGRLTKLISEKIGVELHCAAQDFIINLPSNPLYINGPIIYPPRGQGDIATLMAAFAASQISAKQELCLKTLLP